PATKAITTVSLFGTMSSNSTLATVKTSMTVPNGVLVNYSSPAPAGYAQDTFPLRSGVVIPSGPVKVAASDFSNSIFNTATRKLTINLVNLNRLPLMGNAIGSGAEIATLNFGLSSTATIASRDSSVEVYQDRLPDSFAIPLNGCLI